MTDTNAITRVSYGFLTGNLWGSELTEGYDVAASVARYKELLGAALAAEFPNAEIEIEYQDGEGVQPVSLAPHAWTSEREWVDDEAIFDTINRISDEIWQGCRWYVAAEEV